MANTKFRAFHKPSKTMYWFDIMNGNTHGTDSGYISMAPFGEPITKFRHKDNLTPVDPEDCELMQFTGLHDKNRKEIYEGDIIIAANGSKQTINWGEWNFELNNDNEEINGIGFSFSGGEPFGSCVEGGGSLYTIIGNIHQTPELLNSKEVEHG